MSVALLSDINGNWEALTATLDDIESQNIRTIICLGDAIGYGPDPLKCLIALRQRATVYLRGRLESCICDNAYADFSAIHRTMLEFTRQSVDLSDNIEWLRTRELVYKAANYVAAHDNPNSPQSGCLMFDDVVGKPSVVARLLSGVAASAFIGDNHCSWAIDSRGSGKTDRDLGFRLEMSDAHPVLVSVGSVGQPRDGDSRASYVIVTDNNIVWRRVPYNIDATIAKMDAEPRLDNRFAERLRRGL